MQRHMDMGVNTYFLRLGVFAAVGIAITVGFSFYVNDKPYWYRDCNYVDIVVDDATGLRRKSAVKTLGLDIGYITSVDLDRGNVLLRVCITASVGVREDTKAYVRTLGFLGDRFLELRPMNIYDSKSDLKKAQKNQVKSEKSESSMRSGVRLPATILENKNIKVWKKLKEKWENQWEKKWKVRLNEGRQEGASLLYNFLFPSAEAADDKKRNPIIASREKELADTMENVDKLLIELTFIAKDLRSATKDGRLKRLVNNLNAVSENLAKMLANGQDSEYVKEIMESLKKAAKGVEKALTKLGEGEGSIGKLLVDEELYNEAVAAVRNINSLLGKASALKTMIDISSHHIDAYDGAKAHFSLKIEPNPSRYYLVGISTDPRGKEEKTTTTTVVNGGSPTIEEKIVKEENGLKFTLVFGKYYGPLDLHLGLMENTGMLGVGYWFDKERRVGILAQLYKDTNVSVGEEEEDPIRSRVFLRGKFFKGLYVKAGVEDFRKADNGKIPYFIGFGISFTDNDIKYLLAFR